MAKRNWFSTCLVLLLLAMVSLTLLASKGRESDSQALIRIKTNQNKAPKIDYPVKDVKGRLIPTFDYLIVFPDCTSCSDFRSKARTFMEANPQMVFLILTPDMKGGEDLLTHSRYFVYQFSSNSKYAKIVAGGYAR